MSEESRVAQESSMAEAPLLDSYLKRLRLLTFLAQWRAVAEDAAAGNRDYAHLLLAFAQQ